MEDVIKTAIAEVLTELNFPLVDFTVAHPNDLDHGDYASNVALILAKPAGQPPKIIAATLVASLADKIEYVDRIEVAGAGFINFYLSRDFYLAEIIRANQLDLTWGQNDLAKAELMLIEYTSPNLFKPLHIGNLVGNIVGEAYTRLSEFSGATVKRLNYPSDIGLPVAKSVWGLKKIAGDPTDINALGLAYKTGNEAYDTDSAAKAEIIAINQALYAGTDPELNHLRETGVSTSKQQLDELCAKLGTIFDAEITESAASVVGTKIVTENIGPVFEPSEGAIVYPEAKSGLHTRVFLNSQGLPTYEAKDLGNFTLKQEQFPDWTTSVVVTGNEQTEYFKVIYSAIREIFPAANNKQLIHIPTGFLSLTSGKMSSRQGNVLTGESLFNELEEASRQKASASRADDLEELSTAVAVSALKYQILKHNLGSNIIFDKEKALSFEGDSGPYLQYTHARLCSVMEKAEVVGLKISYTAVPAIPYAIEKILYQFPEIILSAWTETSPHLVTGYLTELAGAFNSFYAQEKIVASDDIYAPYKLAIVNAVRLTLKNGLWVLGIKAPEGM